MTVYFSETAPENARWYKYNSVEGWQNYSDHAVFSDDMTSVVITLQDGGIGDDDGIENGIIVDPSGYGVNDSLESEAGSGCFVKAAGDSPISRVIILVIAFATFIYLLISIRNMPYEFGTNQQAVKNEPLK